MAEDSLIGDKRRAVCPVCEEVIGYAGRFQHFRKHPDEKIEDYPEDSWVFVKEDELPTPKRPEVPEKTEPEQESEPDVPEIVQPKTPRQILEEVMEHYSIEGRFKRWVLARADEEFIEPTHLHRMMTDWQTGLKSAREIQYVVDDYNRKLGREKEKAEALGQQYFPQVETISETEKKMTDLTPDLDKMLSKHMERLVVANIMKTLGDGRLPTELAKKYGFDQSGQALPQPMSQTSSQKEESEFERMLNKMLNYQVSMSMMKMLQGGDGSDKFQMMLERQDQRHREEMQALQKGVESGVGKLLGELNERLQALERGASVPRDEITEELKRTATQKMINDLTKKGWEQDDIKTFIESTIKSSVPLSTGKLNQFDAEVEKVKAEVDGKKTSADLEYKARIEEAKAKRESFQYIADAIRDAVKEAGIGVGMGIGRVGEVQQPRVQPPPPPPPPKEVTVRPMPVVDQDGKPTGHFKFDCVTCGAPIDFEAGTNKVTCPNPNCKETYDFIPSS